MTRLKQLLSELCSGEKRTKLIIILGSAAVLLILLSDMLPSCTAEKPVTSSQFSSTEYARALEAEIEDIVSSIKGAGNTKVFVTLENSEEYIYASDSRENNDQSESYDNGDLRSSDERNDSEQSIIIIDGEDGKEALIRTVILPTVAGVVIVCEGAEDEAVRERIVDAVTTALGISSRRVCVTILKD